MANTKAKGEAKMTRTTTRTRARSESLSDIEDLYASEPKKGRSKNTSLKLTKEAASTRTKKTTSGAAVMAKKNAIYTDARKRGKETSQQGTQLIEEIRERLRGLKAQETPLERHLIEYGALSKNLEEAYTKLRATYPPLFEVLGPRRSETIDVASRMVQEGKSQREAATTNVVRKAGRLLQEAKENEKVNSDASELIKRYKAILKY